MRISRYVRWVLALALCGCQDPLAVGNTNNPDRNGALGTAADLESFFHAQITAGLKFRTSARSRASSAVARFWTHTRTFQ